MEVNLLNKFSKFRLDIEHKFIHHAVKCVSQNNLPVKIIFVSRKVCPLPGKHKQVENWNRDIFNPRLNMKLYSVTFLPGKTAIASLFIYGYWNLSLSGFIHFMETPIEIDNRIFINCRLVGCANCLELISSKVLDDDF